MDIEILYEDEREPKCNNPDIVIDFEDILILTYKALCEENYQEKYEYSSYDWIEIDEVQDFDGYDFDFIECNINQPISYDQLSNLSKSFPFKYFYFSVDSNNSFAISAEGAYGSNPEYSFNPKAPP